MSSCEDEEDNDDEDKDDVNDIELLLERSEYSTEEKDEEDEESNVLSTTVDSPSNNLGMSCGVVVILALYSIFEMTSCVSTVEDVVVVICDFLFMRTQ